MSAAYIPVKGDRIRHSSWFETEWLDVLCVGGQQVFGIDNDGDEWCPRLDGAWIKVETPTPLPERWINVGAESLGNDWQARGQAYDVAGHSTIAVLHIWTDADGNDHVEIERVG